MQRRILFFYTWIFIPDLLLSKFLIVGIHSLCPTVSRASSNFCSLCGYNLREYSYVHPDLFSKFFFLKLHCHHHYFLSQHIKKYQYVSLGFFSNSYINPFLSNSNCLTLSHSPIPYPACCHAKNDTITCV